MHVMHIQEFEKTDTIAFGFMLQNVEIQWAVLIIGGPQLHTTGK